MYTYKSTIIFSSNFSQRLILKNCMKILTLLFLQFCMLTSLTAKERWAMQDDGGIL